MKQPIFLYQPFFPTKNITVRGLVSCIISGCTFPLLVLKIHSYHGKLNHNAIYSRQTDQKTTTFIKLFNPLFVRHSIYWKVKFGFGGGAEAQQLEDGSSSSGSNSSSSSSSSWSFMKRKAFLYAPCVLCGSFFSLFF